MDKDYNVFLIEANTNPCLEESSQLLAMLLPRMLDDMFKLTIDKIFPMNLESPNRHLWELSELGHRIGGP